MKFKCNTCSKELQDSFDTVKIENLGKQNINSYLVCPDCKSEFKIEQSIYMTDAYIPGDLYSELKKIKELYKFDTIDLTVNKVIEDIKENVIILPSDKVNDTIVEKLLIGISINNLVIRRCDSEKIEIVDGGEIITSLKAFIMDNEPLKGLLVKELEGLTYDSLPTYLKRGLGEKYFRTIVFYNKKCPIEKLTMLFSKKYNKEI